MSNEDILAALHTWEGHCTFELISAGRRYIDLEFTTLPDDLLRFAHEVITLCPAVFDATTMDINPFGSFHPEGDWYNGRWEDDDRALHAYERQACASLIAQRLQRSHRLEWWWN